MKRQLLRLTAATVVAFLVAPAVSASGATSGLAWDSVTKMTMSSDGATLEPGSFDDDYATASSVQPPSQSGGGLFGHLKATLAMGQTFQQMMADGFAERHYVAGSRERTDSVAMQTATITDCVARTITTLNLRDKTYKVVSMDQPSTSNAGGGSNDKGGSFKDNGERMAIAVTNAALGERDVGGEPTHGFRSDMTFTEINASGESHSQNANVVGYYSGLAMPAPQCSRFGAWSAGIPAPAAGVASLATATRAMRALQYAGLDKRFSLKQSGPALPVGRMSMWEAMTFAAGGNRGGMTFVTERGHVRPISANDPIFGIPAGFTQER